jgi:hypothetical protein
LTRAWWWALTCAPERSTIDSHETLIGSHSEKDQVWLQIVALAHDLIVWTRRLLLTGELANAEPKRLRYRLLHAPPRSRSSKRSPHQPETRRRAATIAKSHPGAHAACHSTTISTARSAPRPSPTASTATQKPHNIDIR